MQVPDNLYQSLMYAEEYKDTLHLLWICNTVFVQMRIMRSRRIKWNDKRLLQYIQDLTLCERISSIYVTRASLYNKSGLPDSTLYFCKKG